jgi:hypothetical protein
MHLCPLVESMPPLDGNVPRLSEPVQLICRGVYTYHSLVPDVGSVALSCKPALLYAVDLSKEEFAELKADAKFPGSRYPVNGLLRKVGQHPKGAELLKMVAQVLALCRCDMPACQQQHFRLDSASIAWQGDIV